MVDEPKLVGFRTNINADDNPDAFDNSFGIARIPSVDKFDVKRIVFVGNRIVKQRIAVPVSDN